MPLPTKILKQIRPYIIFDTDNLDCDSISTSRSGHIETWGQGFSAIYCIRGNLPEYVCKELAKIAESRGYKYYYNFGKRKDCV